MAPYPEWTLEESLAGTGLQRFVGNGRERPAQDGTAEASESYEPALHAPRRWGLSAEAVAHLLDSNKGKGESAQARGHVGRPFAAQVEDEGDVHGGPRAARARRRFQAHLHEHPRRPLEPAPIRV